MSAGSTSDRVDTVRAVLGVAAVAVSMGGITAAALLAPWFSPFEYALSNLGERGRTTAPLFNLSLLLGGALGSGFVVAVWPSVEDGVRRGALVVLSFAMVFLALTGAFPLPTAMHSVVAPLFFLLMTVGVFAWGVGDFAVGRVARGSVLVVAAVVHVVGWLWWALLGWPGDGIAVPELLGAVALAVWALWLSVDAYRDGTGDRPAASATVMGP